MEIENPEIRSSDDVVEEAAVVVAPVLTAEDAERALLRMGEVARARDERKAALDQAVAELKESYRVDVGPIEAEGKGLKAALRKYAKKQKKGWEKEGRRSEELLHGVLGFREISKLQVPSDEDAFLAKLHELGLEDCIRRYERPDLQALSRLTDDVLAQAGCERQTRDEFFAEPKSDVPAGEA